jgi:hypothetical protein
MLYSMLSYEYFPSQELGTHTPGTYSRSAADRSWGAGQSGGGYPSFVPLSVTLRGLSNGEPPGSGCATRQRPGHQLGAGPPQVTGVDLQRNRNAR